MDLLTLLFIVVIGLVVIKLVGKILKMIVGIGLVLLIIYVLSTQLGTSFSLMG